MRLLLLWEWLTFIPNETPLPQKSHFAICCTSSRALVKGFFEQWTS